MIIVAIIKAPTMAQVRDGGGNDNVVALLSFLFVLVLIIVATFSFASILLKKDNNLPAE
jgi:hypothetical protein